MKLKDLVKDIMMRYPEDADDNTKLVARVWQRQLKNSYPDTFLAMSFLNQLHKGDEFAKTESITRARRDLRDNGDLDVSTNQIDMFND